MRSSILASLATLATLALFLSWSVHRAAFAAGAHGKGPGFTKGIYAEKKKAAIKQQKKAAAKAAKAAKKKR